MKKWILAFLFCALALSARAKEIEVEAVGIGKDYDWALMNALDNAVKQTSDVTINRHAPMQKMEINSRETLNLAENEQLNIDDGAVIGGKKSADYSGNAKAEHNQSVTAEIKEINAEYEGKVASYDVISSEQSDGKYIVKIKAKVKQLDDYESPDLIKKARYSLSVVPFKAPKKISCLGKSVPSMDLTGKLSSILAERISKSKKFNLVDRDNLEAYADELSLVDYNLTKDGSKNRLKNLVTADYILVGKVEDFRTNKNTQNVPMTGESYSNSSASIQVSYKLLETATMEVLLSSSVEEKLKKGGSFSSCAAVESALAKAVGHKISTEILSELFPDYKPELELEKKAEKKAAKKAAVRPAQKTKVIKLPFD